MDGQIMNQYVLNGCYIEVTDSCNLKCLHCYNDSGNKSNFLSEEAFKRIIDSLPNNGTASITLSGGEPFVFISLV